MLPGIMRRIRRLLADPLATSTLVEGIEVKIAPSLRIRCVHADLDVVLQKFTGELVTGELRALDRC